MTENQFDEFFRKKLEDYSSKVPEDMWQRIKQKKDRDRTFIILLLLLLFIGGATSYFIFNGKETANKNISLSQKQTNKNNNNAVTNQNKKHETITTPNDSLNLSENKNSITVNEINRNGLNIVAINKAKITAKKSAEKNFTNKNRNETEGKNLNVSNIPQQNISPNNIDSLKNNFSAQSSKPDAEVTLKNEKQQTSIIKQDSLKQEKKNTQVYKAKKNHSLIINNIFLEIYASPDIPVSRTQGNSAYLQHKDSTSNMQLSYTFGVRVGALLGEHFIIKTGIQYSQVNEKFNYSKKNATRTIPVVVQRTLPDANGVERTVLDTSTLIQVGSQYKLNYNHYKSFDVPLLIGYQTAGDRLRAAFNTGIILNIKTTYKGDILDSSLNAVDVNSKSFYKDNTGVSLYFGLGLSTKLNDKFQLFTEPYIRYRLSNMTNSNQAFSQKINVGGLSLGLRYNFKN